MKPYRKLILFPMALLLLLSVCPAAVYAAPGSGKSNVPPMPPKNQTQVNSIGTDLFGSWSSGGTTTVVGGVVDHYSSKYDTISKSFANTADSYQRTHSISGNARALERMRRAEEASSVAGLKGSRINIGGKILSGASLGKDAYEYLEPSKHKHSSMALLDQTLRGINLVAGSLDFVGYKPAKPLAIAGALLKDTVGGSTFADWCNDQDNFIIYGLDTTTDAINDWTTYAWTYYMDLFNGTEDANVYGRPPYGTGVYKPNIYLYPQTPMEITVSFGLPSLLTVTIPQYTRQWRVTASPDGSLTDVGDGRAYDFLFYESLTDTALFTYDTGWIIRAGSREDQFAGILTAYGFNDKEISDFIAFWREKLEPGTDYVLYPQVTRVIDGAMPISIVPEPVNIFRLWAAFEEYTGQSVDEPEVAAMSREGFTLVEWGGFFLDR